MRCAILFFICFFSFGNLSVDNPTNSNDTTTVDVRLEIRAKEKVIRKGTTPNVEVFLINKGDKLVNLVQPGDGSESGWRTPMVKWSTRIIEQKSVPVEYYEDSKEHWVSFPLRLSGLSRCGMIDGLKREQIITLLPKQEVMLKSWVSKPSLLGGRLGKYGVKFFYENKPDIVWKGAGYNDPDALEIVRTKTAAVQLESNELIFEVVE